MTAENGSGNGELRQLLEIKRAYRKDVATFEADLTAKFDRELEDGKKLLKQEYLEEVVDTVFADAPPAPSKLEAAKAPASAPAEPESAKCPECESPVDPMDKFCAECATPLKESENDERPSMENYPVASAGSQLRKRHRA